ncbi:MAG: DapH/DapD/GlmU-related protein [Ardenticatenaceae bacterium]|nr:DapH/DapD/GlmU-related protein [Ardenticatenaceae bacterium]
MTNKISQKISNEFFSISYRLLLLKILLAPIPHEFGVRIRTLLMRLLGFRIGRGTVFIGLPTFLGGRQVIRNFKIGSLGLINVQCLIDCSGPVILGDNVYIGPRVQLITGDHEIGTKGRRASHLRPKPIRIHSGTWVGSGAIILPGVTIREGCIIAAGAVVTKDFPPNQLIAGIPAKSIRELSDE